MLFPLDYTIADAEDILASGSYLLESGAKQLLNALGMTPGGRRLAKLFPQAGANSDLTAAIVLVNMEIQKYLDVGSAECDLLTEEQLRHAHDGMDTTAAIMDL